MRSLLPFLIFLTVLVLMSANGQSSCDPSGVCTLQRHKGDTFEIVLFNRLPTAITISAHFTALENMQVLTAPPAVVLVRARGNTGLLRVRIADPDRHWHFDYTYRYRLGTPGTRHDDRYVYRLPFPAGNTFLLSQGAGGFTHTGESEHCIDWTMPEGTVVRAARDGIVATVRADSHEGGPEVRFRDSANYVRILHPDGTIGEYFHLLPGGILVRPGARVEAGTRIGLSGNTGLSTEPHLHFCVVTPVDGVHNRSLPVFFQTADGERVPPIQGEYYTAR